MPNNNPVISIIMSIYNSAATLNYSIDSLVYQSFENIEIILVDKASTDNSGEIIDMYAKQFPEKVKACHIDYSPSPGSGWNYGISIARGEYIAFCDSDDAYHLNAMEILNNMISESHYDFIFYYAQLKIGNTILRTDKFTNDFKKENLICCDKGMNAVWNKLWHKSIFEKTGPIPDTMGMDVVYCPAGISNAEKLGECTKVLYYHTAEGGNTKGNNALKFKYFFDAWDSLFTLNYNKNFEDEVFTGLARRICISLKTAPRFTDDIALWVKNHKEFFEDNEVLKKRKDIWKIINKLLTEYNTFIPKDVYLNGFGNTLSEDWIDTIKEKAFNFKDANIIILNETNCDCSALPILTEALQKKEYRFLGQYFALKRINESGGFFLGSNIQMNISLNNLRCINSTIFAFFDTKSFMDDFFASLPDSKPIADLLFTYENDFYDQKFQPLSMRLKNILSGKYDIVIDGQHQKNQFVHILSPNICSVNIEDGQNIFSVDLSAETNSEGFKIVNTDVLELMSSTDTSSANYKRIISSLQTELANIKKSDTYKLAKKLQAFGNTKLGYIPKKIFKFLLKKYRKIRYGME